MDPAFAWQNRFQGTIGRLSVSRHRERDIVTSKRRRSRVDDERRIGIRARVVIQYGLPSDDEFGRRHRIPIVPFEMKLLPEMRWIGRDGQQRRKDFQTLEILNGFGVLQHDGPAAFARPDGQLVSAGFEYRDFVAILKSNRRSM